MSLGNVASGLEKNIEQKKNKRKEISQDRMLRLEIKDIFKWTTENRPKTMAKSFFKKLGIKGSNHVISKRNISRFYFISCFYSFAINFKNIYSDNMKQLKL